MAGAIYECIFEVIAGIESDLVHCSLEVARNQLLDS